MARRLAGSTHGRALLAIREDEVAAEAMGVDTTGYKVRAFVIAAAFAGLAGGLLVHSSSSSVTPRIVHLREVDRGGGDGGARRHGLGHRLGRRRRRPHVALGGAARGRSSTAW